MTQGTPSPLRSHGEGDPAFTHVEPLGCLGLPFVSFCLFTPGRSPQRALPHEPCHHASSGVAASGRLRRVDGAPLELGCNQCRLHPAHGTCKYLLRYLPSRFLAFLPCSFPLWVSPKGAGRRPEMGLRSRPSAHSGQFNVRQGAPRFNVKQSTRRVG